MTDTKYRNKNDLNVLKLCEVNTFGFTNFFYKHMLKMSAFYPTKQKSFIPKTKII